MCKVKHRFCSQPQNSISRLRMREDVCKNQSRGGTSPEAKHHLPGAQEHLGAALRTCQGSVCLSLILTLLSKRHFSFLLDPGGKRGVRRPGALSETIWGTCRSLDVTLTSLFTDVPWPPVGDPRECSSGAGSECHQTSGHSERHHTSPASKEPGAFSPKVRPRPSQEAPSSQLLPIICQPAPPQKQAQTLRRMTTAPRSAHSTCGHSASFTGTQVRTQK